MEEGDGAKNELISDGDKKQSSKAVLSSKSILTALTIFTRDLSSEFTRKLYILILAVLYFDVWVQEQLRKYELSLLQLDLLCQLSNSLKASDETFLRHLEDLKNWIKVKKEENSRF